MNLDLVNPSDPHAVRRAFQTIQRSLGYSSSPVFVGLTLSGLTATRLVQSDASKGLASVTDLTGWIAGTANEVDVADDGDGTITIGLVNPLIVGKGGTGAATLTDHGLLLGSGTDAITVLAAATNGQLPIGSTGADPVLAALTAGAGIDITNGAGTITVASTITQYTDEMAQDAVGGILDNGTVGNIVFTYDDVGNVISAVTQDGEIDHDALLNFVAAEHLSLPNTIANVLSDHDLAAHTALGLFDASSDVDHDATTNFVADEHVAHSTMTVAIGNGGTGQTTAQAAIDALTQVSGATNEHILTKDTATGNAIFKAAPSGDTYKLKVDSGATEDYLGAASSDGVLRTGAGLSYTDGGNYVTLAVSGAFVDRGDPASYDLTETSMTIDDAWHDWDLSSVVPAGAVAVLFGVAISNTGAGRSIYLRKNGNTNVRNASLVQTQVASLTVRFDLVTACDANRVIEYYVENLGTWSINITIRGWWI